VKSPVRERGLWEGQKWTRFKDETKKPSGSKSKVKYHEVDLLPRETTDLERGGGWAESIKVPVVLSTRFNQWSSLVRKSDGKGDAKMRHKDAESPRCVIKANSEGADDPLPIDSTDVTKKLQ